MLDRLCCKKKRNSEIETTNVAMGEKADSSDLANEKANHDLETPEIEEPWIKNITRLQCIIPGSSVQTQKMMMKMTRAARLQKAGTS